MNCRIDHLEEEDGGEKVRPLLLLLLLLSLLLSLLFTQVKLVITLKTVKEKLVREKLDVGGENLPTVKLEVRLGLN